MFPIETDRCTVVHVFVENFDPAVNSLSRFQLFILTAEMYKEISCITVLGDFSLEIGQRGCEDTLLSLLGDGTTSTKTTDNLDYYYHGVL